jgi:hypothetical protein
MIVNYSNPPNVGKVTLPGVNTPITQRQVYMGRMGFSPFGPISPWNRDVPQGMGGYVVDPTTGDAYYIDDETGEVIAADGNTYGESDGGFFDWISSVFTGENVKAVLTAAQAYQLQQINLERAQRGLAPLSAAQYAPTVNVGVNQDTQRMLMIGAIALGAVLLLSKSGSGKKGQ